MNPLEKILSYVVLPAIAVTTIATSSPAIERVPRKDIEHLVIKKHMTIKGTTEQAPSKTDEQHYVIKKGDIIWKLIEHCNPALPDTTIARYINALYAIQNLHETYKPNFKTDNRSFVKTSHHTDSLTHNKDDIVLDETYPGNILSYTNDQLERKHIDKETIFCLNALSAKKGKDTWSLDVTLAYEKINEIIDRVNEQDKSIDSLYERTDSLNERQNAFDLTLKTIGTGINSMADDMKKPKLRMSIGTSYNANEGFSPVVSLGARVHDARNPTWIGLDINGATQKEFSKDSIVYDGGSTVFDKESNMQRIRISPYIDQRVTIGHSNAVLGLQAGPSFDLAQHRLSVTTTQRVDDMYGNPRSWKSERLPDTQKNETAVLFNYGGSLKTGRFDFGINQQVAKGRKPTSTMKLGYYFGN